MNPTMLSPSYTKMVKEDNVVLTPKTVIDNKLERPDSAKQRELSLNVESQ